MKKQKEKKGKSGGHPKRRILVALAGSLVLPLIGGTSIHAKAAERGLEFDLDSYIQMEENLGEIPDTIEIILNVKDGVKERQVIFGNYESDSKKSFSVELTADGKLRYYERIVEEGGYVDVRSDEAVKTGEEIQLTVVRDAQNDQISLYQNEKLIKQQQVSYDLKEEDAGQPHFVGTDYRKKYFVQAEISRIALWNDERTESEISSDKSAEIKGDEEDLKNCWELSEDLRNEPRVEDLTENGIGGILNGFKVYEKEGTDFSEGIQRTEMAENLPEEDVLCRAWAGIPVYCRRCQSLYREMDACGNDL